MNNNKSFLIKRKSLLLAGIKENGVDSIIPFNNMAIQLSGTNTDPNSIVIPTIEEVLRMVKELVETQFDVKYVFEYIQGDMGFAGPIPTADEMEALYQGAGIPVEDFNGNHHLIQETSNPMNEGEGISVIDTTSGTFEVAGFQGGRFNISNLKNDIPLALAKLQADIDINKASVDTLTNDINSYELHNLKDDNSKDVADTFGGIPVDGTNEAHPLRIATREVVRVAIESMVGSLAGNSQTKTITQLESDNIAITNRLQIIEAAENKDDKVWSGTIVLGADTDLSAIVDQNGDTFDWTTGKRLEVVIEKTATTQEQGHTLTVDNTNSTPYVIGTRNVAATIDSSGHLHITGNDLSNLNVIEVREPKGAVVIPASYSKTESDAKYAVKSVETTKQDKTDNALSTTNKSIVGGINELVGEVNTLKAGNTIDTTTLAALEAKLGL